jgi:GAF domain-containing protein
MNLAHEIEAYAAYINAPRHQFDDDELELLDADTAKALAAMECAWLDAKPTIES